MLKDCHCEFVKMLLGEEEQLDEAGFINFEIEDENAVGDIEVSYQADEEIDKAFKVSINENGVAVFDENGTVAVVLEFEKLHGTVNVLEFYGRAVYTKTDVLRALNDYDEKHNE